MAQFEKLMDTKQIQITHDLGLFHGQSSKLGGSQLSTDRLVKRRPSQEEECLCIDCDHVWGVHLLSSWCDGRCNKAAYLRTPKNPGCPTYEVNLLQFWINRWSTLPLSQWLKNYGPSPPVKTKHTLSLVLALIWHIVVITSEASRLKRALQDLQGRLMVMGPAVC